MNPYHGLMQETHDMDDAAHSKADGATVLQNQGLANSLTQRRGDAHRFSAFT